MFVPLLLVYIVDGRRGLRQTWLPAVVCGVAFAIGQFVCAELHLRCRSPTSWPRSRGAAAVVLLLRVWQPVESPVVAEPSRATVGAGSGGGSSSQGGGVRQGSVRGGKAGVGGREGGEDLTTVDAAGGTSGRHGAGRRRRC